MAEPAREAASMPLLLDTHVFLWWRANEPRLGAGARHAIASAPLVYVSAASAWEASIKVGLGRLRLPESFETGVRESGFEQLPMVFRHAERAGGLAGHHRDPFDRMLVAQALEESLVLVTADRQLFPYEVPVLWAD
ncbi:MAG TPA: type II toxin-antitoxin system VapC family toxin [Thermoanaerobaculia bacterium]|jgi:PIN domain nuclease of toxin-antitoxin system|nr:type II toxin-antitoxin system VapC family toxin [Thermoanaerobaculia bacterium]